MIERFSPSLLSALLVFSFSCQKENTAEVEEPKPTTAVADSPEPTGAPEAAPERNYLPDELSAFTIGMSLEAFDGIQQSDPVKVTVPVDGTDAPDYDRNKGLFYLHQERSEDALKSVTYQFSDGTLYEVIVEVGSPELALALANQQMAMPANNGEKWKLPANADGLTLIAWVFENKYVLADSSHF